MSFSGTRGWLAVFALGSSACGGAPAARTAASSEAQLRIATYNVNYALAGDPEATAAIRATAADVVLLQETNADWEAHLNEALGDDYAHRRFVHRAAAGGLGVLSRFELEEQELLEPPSGGWFPAWRMEMSTPIGRVQLLNVHLRPQLSESGSFLSGYFVTPEVRYREMATYYKQLDATLPTLVAGDFNEGADGMAIAYLERRGFRSALPEAHGSAATWHWPTSIGTVSAQLDHIAYNPALSAASVRVVQRGGSDHLPVVAVFSRATLPTPADQGPVSSVTSSCSYSSCSETE